MISQYGFAELWMDPEHREIIPGSVKSLGILRPFPSYLSDHNLPAKEEVEETASNLSTSIRMLVFNGKLQLSAWDCWYPPF